MMGSRSLYSNASGGNVAFVLILDIRTQFIGELKNCFYIFKSKNITWSFSLL